MDSQAFGVTVVKARLEMAAQPCSLAACASVCSRLPVSKQCLSDLQPATFEPWPVTAHWSNKIARVFLLLKASDCVPGTSRAGRFPWVQQQQSWPLLLHKPPVVKLLP